MRAYISGALLNAADLDRSRAVYEAFAAACREAGWETYLPHDHADPIRDAHLANRDTAVMTMVSVLFGGLLMLADWARRSLFFARQGSRAVNPLALLVLPLLVLLTPLLSRLLAMAVSRRREYQADATAVEFTRNPEGLARALEKIAGSEFPLRAATRGSAHLFIISPLRRRPDDGDDAWAALFATHPPLAQRVALLRGLAQ